MVNVFASRDVVKMRTLPETFSFCSRQNEKDYPAPQTSHIYCSKRTARKEENAEVNTFEPAGNRGHASDATTFRRNNKERFWGPLESLRKWSNTGSGLRFVRFSARSTTFYSTSENRTNRKPGPRSIAFRNNVRTSFRSSGARCL